ncbi:similar to Saccharomyces cerevisiae YDR299W BFR2 Essential protein that is a component of 90S preribosomes [Maudiozyma barnettii]|uniref:Protein BFR2 n=1 Tax=Maudiozyma barnettii TaxID=61262 RepID=A0A8H2VGE9_9SACH|nr:rRNA-processing protein BFR2 [Kazachstania barnettii]CAB4254961.1 similar to Saccharomyces cerevisiae YDR299W BFR2 Essential protein that is a component of 90S preribosomes [Kazachstania barnettii]CAD1783232.1 similar to Saccharomyces cerevisiae YDR299W BFR2 Essential protein that is a component of 90S preribosomes [Kazachstania barnettii]
MAKTLSEQISEIANRPVNPDVDIEDGERAVFEHHDSSDDNDSDDGQESQAQAHYVSVGKSKLRESVEGAELQDSEKYQGAVGSRDALFGNDASHHVPDQDIESESEEEEEEETVGSDNESSASEEVEEEESDGDEIASKREQLARLVEEERSSAIQRLSRNAQRDAAKGYSILQQTRTFDSIIDVRIKLQKVLNAANAMPLTTESWDEEFKENSKNKKLLKQNKKLLREVMDKLIDFRNIFQTKDHILPVSEQSESPSRKRSCQELDDELRKYRTAVLKKWSSKIEAASGNALLGSTKFKAINQSADVQVENQLADMTRLVKRTRLNRRNIVPLRFMTDLKSNRLNQLGESNDNMTHVEAADDEDDNVDIPKNYDPRRKDNNAIDTSENPYIFDDEDFYRVLLNDLIDKKIADNNNNNGTSNNIITISSRSNNKLKKNIDTKASKGRKLNFTVQEPIANFEAPVNNGYKWSDEQIDEFFAGLLGQRINFDEDETAGFESEDISDDEKQAEVNAIKNDDIQIFG